MANKEPVWNAEEYNSSNGAQYRDAIELINKLIQDGNSSSDMVIVDIGHGSGNVTKMLNKVLSCKKIVACDIDAQMVDYANKSKQDGDENIEFFTQDISVPWEQLDERLKKLEGKVDIVFSNAVLHWVSDKAAAVNTIVKMLKPGGHCYISVPFFGLHELFAAEDKHENQSKYFRLASPEEHRSNWNTIFQNCGLRQVNQEVLEENWTYETTEEKMKIFKMEEVMRCLGNSHFEQLPEDEKTILAKTMGEMFLKSWETPFGMSPYDRIEGEKLTIYYRNLRVVGQK